LGGDCSPDLLGCYSHAGKRGDGDAFDHRHDLKRLRHHSRVCAESLKGVKGATVSLQTHEAVVKYDPEQVKVEDLIKAVKEARGMHAYDAKVKNK
jgi:cation transport ATPase